MVDMETAPVSQGGLVEVEQKQRWTLGRASQGDWGHAEARRRQDIVF